MIPDFLSPERLWLLVVPIGLAVLYVVVLRWRRGAVVRFTQVDLLDKVAPARPRWRRHVVAVLQLAGLAAAVIAIARPVDLDTERTETDGRILVLFDVSLSMQATDVDPDRFTAAQDAARGFVEAVDPGVEVGLVSFSGIVTTEVDPTSDREAVIRGIDRLELAESTAIGDALTLGTRLITKLAEDDPAGGVDERGDDDPPPGVIVLLSDGETTVGSPTPVGAANAAAAGIPVYTIAFGTEDGAIVDPETGEVVPVPVRPADLQEVADVTGGAAFVAETGGELVGAYEQISEQLGRTLGEEIEIVTELTWRFALAAFILLAVAWGLALWWLRGLV